MHLFFMSYIDARYYIHSISIFFVTQALSATSPSYMLISFQQIISFTAHSNFLGCSNYEPGAAPTKPASYESCHSGGYALLRPIKHMPLFQHLGSFVQKIAMVFGVWQCLHKLLASFTYMHASTTSSTSFRFICCEPYYTLICASLNLE